MTDEKKEYWETKITELNDATVAQLQQKQDTINMNKNTFVIAARENPVQEVINTDTNFVVRNLIVNGIPHYNFIIWYKKRPSGSKSTTKQTGLQFGGK